MNQNNVFAPYLYINIKLSNISFCRGGACINTIKGELNPKPKLSMFCVLSHNYQYFLKYMIILKQFIWELKTCIKISVGQVFFELVIKMCKIASWSITQELLDPLKFNVTFWVFQTICFRILKLVTMCRPHENN